MSEEGARVADGAAGPFAGAPLLRQYDHFLALLDAAVSKVIIAGMAVMSAVLLLQVFYRYLLNDSLAWGWDVPRLCFICVVLLSIPLGVRYNAHVGIDIVFDRLGPAAQRAVRIFNAMFMLLLSVAVTYYAWRLAADTWDQMMPGIRISVGIFYLALAVGQVHTALHVLRIIITGQPSSDHWSET